jgi:hypothetical protein
MSGRSAGTLMTDTLGHIVGPDEQEIWHWQAVPPQSVHPA